MSISFNSIPSNLRIPLFYGEFDNSRAEQGPKIQTYKALVIGQKTSAGLATADVPIRITSADQALEQFGAGSQLHRMFISWFKTNRFTEVWAMPLADNGAGVAPTGDLTFTGPATAAGTVSLYIGGKLVETAVANGDSAATIAAAVVAAIAASDEYLAVTAAQGGGGDTHKVLFTHRHKGTVGNYLDIRLNYQQGEALPAGVAGVVTALFGGTTAPSLTAAISAMAEEQYHVIGFPYTDATSLTALEAELNSRFGPTRMIEGMAFAAASDSHANLVTLGDGRNSPFVSIMGSYKSPTPVEEVAAAVAATVAYYGPIDPARPFQTLLLEGVLPPAQADQFTMAERNLLLFDGISTSYMDAGGKVRIEGLVTTYQENEFGAPDTSYLYVNTLLTLSYLRYDFKATVQQKYPRFKLADDGTRFGPGQVIMTPKLMKSECFVKFRQWEELGLVEGFDQFKRDLIVERNQQNPNRLDILMPPDLVNQLVVVAAKFQFLL